MEDQTRGIDWIDNMIREARGINWLWERWIVVCQRRFLKIELKGDTDHSNIYLPDKRG